MLLKVGEGIDIVLGMVVQAVVGDIRLREVLDLVEDLADEQPGQHYHQQFPFHYLSHEISAVPPMSDVGLIKGKLKWIQQPSSRIAKQPGCGSVCAAGVCPCKSSQMWANM